MVTIWQTTFSDHFACKLVYLESYSTDVCSCVIKKNAGTGSDKAWSQKGDKPLSEPMVTNIIGAYELRINTWRPELPNGHQFADDIFKCVFVKENISTLSQIALDIVPYYEIDNNSALAQVMS